MLVENELDLNTQHERKEMRQSLPIFNDKKQKNPIILFVSVQVTPAADWPISQRFYSELDKSSVCPL